MTDNASADSHDSGAASTPAPESHPWPLTTLVVVILPLVLVPASMRKGRPPVVVPIIEGMAVLILLAVAA